jgi:hypothetical protein
MHHNLSHDALAIVNVYDPLEIVFADECGRSDPVTIVICQLTLLICYRLFLSIEAA